MTAPLAELCQWSGLAVSWPTDPGLLVTISVRNPKTLTQQGMAQN
ncbi:hypothetical protein [Cupriavidus sp. H18C2]